MYIMEIPLKWMMVPGYPPWLRKYSKTDSHHPTRLPGECWPRLEALDVRLVAVHLIATCPRPFGESPVPSWESPRSKSLMFHIFQRGRAQPPSSSTNGTNPPEMFAGRLLKFDSHVPCAATRIRPCASMRIDTSRPCFCGCLNDATAGFPQSSSNTVPTA